MNKKLVLSVLSTAVVASMAASAMAKPKAGFYVGGNVDKYYSIDAFLNHLDTALDEIIDNLDSTTFVDENGKAAPFLSALNAQTEEELNAVTEPARLDHFEKNPYTIVDGTGSYNPEEDEDLLAPEPGELKVESVSAINAKTLEIKFSKAVDFDTVIDDQGTPTDTSDDTLLAGAIDISELDGQTPITEASLSASLSEDGKTLTLIATGVEFFDGKYAVKVNEAVVKDEDGNAIAPYATTINVDDTTRPTITKVSYVDKETVRIYFSEPIDVKGSVNYKRADGVALNPASSITDNLASDGSYLEVDLSGLNAADYNKDIIVEIVGAKDFAGNIISPNPVTKTIKYDATDTVPPSVVSINVLSNKSFEIKFSEELVAAPNVAVTGATVASVTKSATDATKYTVTLSSAVSGLRTVSLGGSGDYTDKSGNNGAAYSKVVNFDVDTTDPIVESTKVEKINGVEYLVVTFNENVNAVDAKEIVGSYEHDSITTDVTLESDTDSSVTAGNYAVPVSLYNPVSGKSKSLKFDLTTLPEGVYTVKLPAGLAVDTFGNDSVEKEITFTRGSDTVVGKPALDTTQDAAQGTPYTASNGILVSTTDNNKISVFFNTKVDAASARNIANYQIEGATVEKAVLRSNSTSGAEVELTLVKDSNTFTGERTVTISGVKSEGGAVMNAVTTTEYLKENVRPTVVKAELTDTDEITLTFSEAMDNTTIDDTADSSNVDFEVYVGGVKVSATTAEALVAGSGDKKFTITVTGGFSSADLAKGIVVKPAAGFAGKDANGNAANFTSVTVEQ
ncbi:hypothetical protein ACT91Q_07180 [Brevibacillus thermoruber]|uniref:hypothetical protein n=1 Tax=Brevibacillus thermoruber TaxID=33942 RepID=UPI0040415FCB